MLADATFNQEDYEQGGEGDDAQHDLLAEALAALLLLFRKRRVTRHLKRI
jgi:hypothetical protein